MRFLSMIRVDETTGQKPSERLMQDMGALMEEMIRDGRWYAPPAFARPRKAFESIPTAAS